MKTRKKINIITAIMLGSLFSFTSCGSEEDTADIVTKDRAVVFSSVIGDVSETPAAKTRATLASTLGTDIGIMGYRYAGTWTGTTETPNFMYQVNATSTDHTNWTTATKYYWPNTDEHMRFFGYTPLSAFTGTNGTLSIKTALGPTKFTSYTVPVNNADQQDLMFGESTEYTCSNGGNVALAFHHILSAISFKSGNNIDGSIESIKLKGIPYTGTYTANTATGGTWAVDALPTEMPNEYTGNLSSTFLMIPQTLPSTAYVVITYKDINSNTQTLTYSLKNVVWNAGNAYEYSINIADNKALLTPTIKAWTVVSGNIQY